MILALNKNAADYRGIHPLLDRALALLTPAYLETVGAEPILLEGKKLYVSRCAFRTQPDENTFYEAHRRYLDIHVVVKGEERLDVAETASLTIDEERSRPENDFYAFTDKAPVCQRAVLRPGSFFVAFPQDAHRCQGQVDGASEVEKVVFKICLD